MHKRILCVLLTALIVLSLIPSFALPTQAASNMKTGEECIEILKKMEGFIKYPIWDYNHYSVGYGSTCEKDDYPDGITLEEADALMREFLADMEEELNKFANRNNIVFSQNQFDALMLFTYNCGIGWLYGNGEFRQAVLDNTSGNDFIYEMVQWSAAGGQILPMLVTRRLIESDMYLNGSYTNVKPASYTFVLYDNNGGSGVRIQGYDYNLTAYVKPIPTRDGYRFLGWYSQAEGGNWITELSKQNAEQTLYAHWQGTNASVRNPVPAAYQRPAYLLATRDFYDIPNGTAAGILDENASVAIRGEYVDDNGVKWGKLSNNFWVKMGDPRIGAGDEAQDRTGIEVSVTGDYVNVRSGPGTQYKEIAAVLEGDRIVITETVDVSGVLWGKFRGGWVCLQYTDYAGGLTPGQPEATQPGENGSVDTVIAEGTVTADRLNIRSVAGTNGSLMGAYNRGDEVEILEKTNIGGTSWGRTSKGWICLTYVKLNEANQPPESTEPETTVPETTKPETTVPGTEEEKPDTQVIQGTSAIVISKTGLNIRSGAGTGFSRVGSYNPGQKIGIQEQKTVDGVLWGRTDKGWVCMQYVRLEDASSNGSGVNGVVNCNGNLNIRSGPGVANRPMGGYPAGTRIVILEQTVVSGQKWGRTDRGWVCMDFVRLEQNTAAPDTTTPSQPESIVPENTKPQEKPVGITGTVTASGLNIRASAGTSGAIVGGYRQGNKVSILEQTVVNGTAWGHTNKGWISLAYVQLDTQTQNPGKTGVITADILCIRKGPGTGNAIVGTYKQGEKVTILETAKVGIILWGCTDKGWICMDYVK